MSFSSFDFPRTVLAMPCLLEASLNDVLTVDRTRQRRFGGHDLSSYGNTMQHHSACGPVTDGCSCPTGTRYRNIPNDDLCIPSRKCLTIRPGVGETPKGAGCTKRHQDIRENSAADGLLNPEWVLHERYEIQALAKSCRIHNRLGGRSHALLKSFKAWRAEVGTVFRPP